MPQRISRATVSLEAINRLDKELRAAERQVNRLTREVEKLNTKATQAAGAGRNLVNFFGGAFLARRAVRGFGQMIQAASDTTESVNKVREVFGDAADAVENFSERGGVAIGASRQATLEMTGTMGNLLVAFGFSEKAAADMSLEMVQLAADLGSFNNVPTVQALEAMRSAFVGQSRPIQQFGVDVRVARLEQLALAKGIDKTLVSTNAQIRAQLAWEAIIQDTRKAQGDFARTSDDLANATKILESNFKDLVAELGDFFIPTAKDVVIELNALITSIRNIGKAAEDSDPRVRRLREVLEQLVPSFGIDPDTAGKAVHRLTEEYDRLAPSISRHIQNQALLTRETSEFAPTIANVVKQQQMLKDGTDDLTDAEKARLEQLERIETIKAKLIQSAERKRLVELAELEILREQIAAEEKLIALRLKGREFQPAPPTGAPRQRNRPPQGTGSDISADELAERSKQFMENIKAQIALNSMLQEEREIRLEFQDLTAEQILMENELFAGVVSVAQGLGEAVIQGEGLADALERAALAAASKGIAGLFGGLIGFAVSGGNPIGFSAGFKAASGFQHGGSFMVGGSGTAPGPDRNLVMFRASQGERVTVQTPEQQRSDNRTITLNAPPGAMMTPSQFQFIMRSYGYRVIINDTINGKGL